MTGTSPFLNELKSGEIALVVWDFDGVVADTEPVQAQSYKLMLQARGHDVPADFFVDMVGRTEPEIWSRLAERYGLEEPLAGLVVERSQRFAALAAHLRPNWFVTDMLGAGANVEHHVVSSGNVDVITGLLERWGISQHFSDISTQDSPPGGPDKETRLRRAIEKAASAAQVLTVEDSARYLAIARGAGARTLGVCHSMNNLRPQDADQLVTV